jgi:hypothetical protein
MGNELPPNHGDLSVLNGPHRCLKWSIDVMSESLKFWMFHEIGRMIMHKIGFFLCVPFLLAMPNTLFAGDTGCEPKSYLFQFKPDTIGISASASVPKYEVNNALKLTGNCGFTSTPSNCSDEDATVIADVAEHLGVPLGCEVPIHADACQGFLYKCEYSHLAGGNLEVDCSRQQRGQDWSQAGASAEISVDSTNYRLTSEARPTSIFTDYGVAVTHELDVHAASATISPEASANSTSGFAEDVFWKADVPFSVSSDTTLTVTLVLHAWRLDMDSRVEDDGCSELSTSYESIVWGGCGVYKDGVLVEGLDSYALIDGVDAWGRAVIELDNDRPMVSDRLINVQLDIGEYVLRSWFHSDTEVKAFADTNEAASLSRAALHNFEVSLYLHSADINGDGVVDLADFSQLLVGFGKAVDDYDQFDHEEIPGDINHDGVVDLADFSILLVQFGWIME